MLPDEKIAPAAAKQPGDGLFIVGCGRSGTTLLRLMLNTHPEMAIPQESHFIYKIARQHAQGHGPTALETDAGWNHLIDYLSTTTHLDAWAFDRTAALQRLRVQPERTHAAAFRTLFATYAETHDATFWADKTPQHVQYLLLLDRLFPRARFIHVVRDGRDVALSLLTRKWGPRRIELAGYYWSWLVLSGIVAGQLLGPHRYYQLRFEDLVTHPEATLRALCQWLGLSYTKAMLAYHQTEAAHTYAQGGTVARRLASPPDPRRLYRWRENMSPYAHRLIHVQAGGLLAYLGYDINHLSPLQQRLSTGLNALLPTAASQPVLDQRLTPLQLIQERLWQGVALLRSDVERFAQHSFRWQQAVAQRMR